MGKDPNPGLGRGSFAKEYDMRKSWLKALSVAATALVFCLAGGCGSGCERKPQATGESAISPVLRQNGLEGRVVLAQFGLVGCELSENGLQQMVRLHRDGIIPDLAYVRVEGSKDARAVDAYFAAKSPPFPVIRDPDGSLAQAMDATVYPRYMLIDKFGRVRYRGKFPPDHLADWVKLLTSEKADPGADVALFGVTKLDGAKLLATTKLPHLKGSVQPLKDSMGAGGLLLVFVDATCPFSVGSIGELPGVASTLKQHGINSVLVHLEDSEQDVRKLHEKRDAGAPVLYDVTTATRLNWGVESVPTLVLLDPLGTVVYSGKAVWRDLGASIEKMKSLPAGSIQFKAAGTSYG